MSQLQINNTILQQRFPHVVTKMNTIKDTDISNVVIIKESLERDTAWLKAVEGLLNDCKIIFVYGFGRGLSIVDLLELYPDRWFFVYEPDEQLFHQSISNYDLSLLLEHPNFYWLSVGKSQLNMLFHMVCSYMQEEMAFVALREYLDHEMELLREVKEKFAEYRKTFFTNKHTENRFRSEWTRNYLNHISDLMETPSIERLFFALEGVTAVIVSSGPSLKEDIEWLKRLRPHVLIISAGSSIQALVNNGIHPHLSVIMDGHPVNNKIFASPATLQAPLLFTTSSYYEISDRVQAEKVHSVMKSDLVTQYFFGLSQEELLLNPTGTVAGTAIQAAACLGAKRIILAGQDLSFPNGKLYTQGIEHFTSEMTNEIEQTAIKKILNVKGTYNTTDESFLSMKDGLENLITALPKIEFINTTRNGAVIEGAPFRPIEEVYEELSIESVDSDTIAQLIRENSSEFDRDEAIQVKERLESTLQDLSKVRQEVASIQKLMRKIREFARTNPVKGQRLIESIEDQWGSIANRGWFSPIFEAIMPIEVAVFDQMLPTIIIERSLIRKSDLIHEHLGKFLNDILKHVPILEEMFIESIDRVNKVMDNRELTEKGV